MSYSIVLASIETPGFWVHEGKLEQTRLSCIDFVNKINNDFDSLNIKNKVLLPEDIDKEGVRHFSVPNIELLLKQDDFFILMEKGYNVRLKSRHEVESESKDFSDVIEAAKHLVNKLSIATTAIDSGFNFNQKCEVHVPGLGLISINRTMLLEDACTDALNEAICNGWRIIAACPQPDQRRPDYILGRYDEGYSSYAEGAVRSASSK